MEALTKKEIEAALLNLEGWNFKNDKLEKEFEFDNFKEALSFIVRIGFEAENLVHHPEIFNVYNKVRIQLSTHDAGDKVTQKDVELATAIENI